MLLFLTLSIGLLGQEYAYHYNESSYPCHPPREHIDTEKEADHLSKEGLAKVRGRNYHRREEIETDSVACGAPESSR